MALASNTNEPDAAFSRIYFCRSDCGMVKTGENLLISAVLTVKWCVSHSFVLWLDELVCYKLLFLYDNVKVLLQG